MVRSRLGDVEVARSGSGGRGVVLVFPGGHATAATPLGTDLYTDLGYRVLTFSRPGYGRTEVGALTASEFVPAVADVCEHLGVTEVAATVGISFGGLQSVQLAARCSGPGAPVDPPQLRPVDAALPGHLARDGGRATRLLAVDPRPHLASRAGADIDSDRGLRLMMSRLSAVPIDSWWSTWTPADRACARATFATMDSGSGFTTDVRQGARNRSRYRGEALRAVPCPTLVTASRDDGGVAFAHAEDLVRSVPDARLVETGAPSHFFWLGPTRSALTDAIRGFLSEV